MREGWVELSLGELTENTRPICYGVLKPGPQVEGGVPLVKITDMDRRILGPEGMQQVSNELDNEFRRSRLQGGEVLLSIQGTVGRVAIAASTLKGANISRTIAVIDPDDRLHNFYLMYVLEKIATQGEFDSAGSTRESLNISTIRDMRISCPPVPEQKRIVDLISSVDSYIDALQQQLESAKRSRNAVLHELLTAGGDDWVEITLDEIADVIMGQSPDGKTYNQEGKGLPFMQGSAEFGEHNPVPEKWCSDPKKIAEAGDLLLSVRAPVGDTNFANQRIAVGRGLSIIRANKKSLTEFIRLVIQLSVAELIAKSGSGMFASITGKNLREFKIYLPPLAEQKRIVEIINTIDVVISQTKLTTSKAQILRSGLLSDLLSGKHEIPTSYDKVMGAA